MHNLEFMIKESLEPPTDYDASASTLVLTTPAGFVRPPEPPEGMFMPTTAARYLVYNNVMKFNK